MIILPDIGWTNIDGRWLYRVGSNGRIYYKLKGANRIYSEKEYKKLTLATTANSNTFRDKYKHLTWR